MIRVFFLRILIAWWMIPTVWLIILPVLWLICGDFKQIVSEMADFTHIIWTGNE